MPDIVVPPGWRDRLEELVGRRRDVWLIAGVVVVVACGAFVLRSRAAAPSIAPPATAPPAVSPAVPGEPTSSPASSTTVTENVILVHVAGAVRRPGLYEMPAGARIADAIELARGPQPVADLDALNLAEPLMDGQKIDVPKRGESTAPVAPASAAPGTVPSTSTTATVNLNTADQVALESIPGIGPVTATAIIAYRTEIGQFESFEQLLEITGIGPATLESMRPYVTL